MGDRLGYLQRQQFARLSSCMVPPPPQLTAAANMSKRQCPSTLHKQGVHRVVTCLQTHAVCPIDSEQTGLVCRGVVRAPYQRQRHLHHIPWLSLPSSHENDVVSC
jgi:hypothetical protein